MLELVAIVLAFVGVLFGAKFLFKPRIAKTTKLEHGEKTKRDAAVEQMTQVHDKNVATVRQEAKEARSRPVSDVLVDLITNGDVSR